MFPTRRRSLAIGSALAAGLIAVGLSGCTPTPPTPTAVPGGAASVTPAPAGSRTPPPTPTPTPTPTQAAPALAVATVRVPISCAEAAPASQLIAALGAPVTLTTPEQQFSQPELRPYAFIEDGALNCAWSSHPGKSGNVTSYRVLVVPDVTPADWDFYKGNGLNPSDPASPFGAETNVNCPATTPKSMNCNLTAYIGTTFVEVQSYSTKVAAVLSGPATLARFTPLFTNILAKVKAATIVEPRFSDPGATGIHYHSDFTISDKAITAAISVPGYRYKSEAWGPIIDEDGPDLEALSPVNFRWEGGGGGTSSKQGYSVSIEVLPAGAWAFPDLISKTSSRPEYAPLAGLGDQAITYSPSGNLLAKDAVVEAISGHNLFLVTTSWYGTVAPARTPEAVAKRVAQAVITGIGS